MNKYQEVEQMLKNYNMTKINIENTEKEIELLEEEDGIKAVGYEMGGSGGEGSAIERVALENVEKLNKKEMKIKKAKLEIEKIDNAIEGLSEHKREIIKGKYLDGLQWWQISGIVEYSERHCKRLRTEAIKELIVGIYGV